MIVVLVTVVSCSGVDSAPEKIELDIQDIAEGNHHIATIESGNGFEGQILKIVPDSEEQWITVWEEGDPGEWLQPEKWNHINKLLKECHPYTINFLYMVMMENHRHSFRIQKITVDKNTQRYCFYHT